MEIQHITSELCEVTERIWKLLFNMPIATANSLEGQDRPGELVRASIEISGSWNGRIQLLTNKSLAGIIAEKLFLGLAAEELGQELVNDAFREIANITGGSLKSSLPDHCKLGLPKIDYCSPNSIVPEGQEPILQLNYLTVGQPYSIAVTKARST